MQNEDTPESVCMQKDDIVTVRKQRPPPSAIPIPVVEQETSDEDFAFDMKMLMQCAEHYDVFFEVYPCSAEDYDDDEGERYGSITTPLSSSTSSSSSSLLSSSAAVITSTSSSSGEEDDCQLIDDAALSMKEQQRSDLVLSLPPTQFADLLEEEDLKNASSSPVVPPSVRIGAHRVILTARSEYFSGLFRKTSLRRDPKLWSGGASPSAGSIRVPDGFDEATVRRLLEFIYTNRLPGADELCAQNLISLLHLADVWLVIDLKRLCEYHLMALLHVSNAGQMLCATERFNARRLQKATVNFVVENIADVMKDPTFIQQIGDCPKSLVQLFHETAEQRGKATTKVP